MHRAILALSLILGITVPAAAQDNLTPPTGSPAETGVTLTDIFDATLAAGGVITATPPRSFVAARIIANGTVISSPDPVDEIPSLPEFVQLFGFEHDAAASDDGSSLPTGRRTYEPIRITKRLDRATPLLFQAFTNNESVDAQFWFFRPNTSGSGVEHYFTITLERARVTSHRVFSNAIAEGVITQEEQVALAVNTIRFTDEVNGTETEDTVVDPAQ